MHDVAIHESHGKRWASPPARPRLDSSGRQQVGENGKSLWQPIIEFDSRAVRDQWSDGVIGALVQAFPATFADEEVAR
jgi:hypothetical protein